MNFISGTVWFVVLRAANQTAPIYHSGRLQEEQRLVTKTCPFFWRTNFPGSSNRCRTENSSPRPHPYKYYVVMEKHPEAEVGVWAGVGSLKWQPLLELHWPMD